MYSQYQRPKKCWKCGGFKVWSPQYNKWICPQCHKPAQVYPTSAYPQSAYAPQYNYPQRPYPPQYNYPQRPYPPYQGPPAAYGRPPYPTYPTTPAYLPASPVGNKLCIYCGATMKEDELICPKCMQKVLVV